MKSLKVSKKAVQRSFSRASSTYDSFSHMQQEVNRLLLRQVPAAPYRKVLEIGCGTGALTERLFSTCQIERLLAVDLSLSMLKVAGRRLSASERIHFVCCDAERLPLKAGAGFDLVITASAMQWFSCFNSSIRELVKNHLETGGHFSACFFGRDSLLELSDSLARSFPDRDTRILTDFFPDYHRDLSGLDRLFSTLRIQRKVIKKEYNNLLHLLRVLKMTGVSPPGKEHRPLLSTRGAVSSVERCYLERFGSITASFEIIFISGRRK